MHGIYTYIPETNYVPREYSVAAVLLLLFMVLVSLVSVLNLLYFYISTSRSVCAVPNMTVFCSSFTSCFPGMLLTYFLNDFEIVPVAPIITGITFVFTFHMRCISIVRSSYFRIFSASLLLLLLLLLLLKMTQWEVWHKKYSGCIYKVIAHQDTPRHTRQFCVLLRSLVCCRGAVCKYCRVAPDQRSALCTPLCRRSQYLIWRWLRGKLTALGIMTVLWVEWDGWYWQGTIHRTVITVNTGRVRSISTILLANENLMERLTVIDLRHLWDIWAYEGRGNRAVGKAT